MPYLIIVTALWAFSFSLIGVYLSGQVDAYISVFSRIFLATVVFLPFLKWHQTPIRQRLYLMGIGAVQLGCMYLFYYHSFLLLSVPEVLLFTVFTPLYITLLNDMLHKTFTGGYLLSASLAVLGAVIIKFSTIQSHFLLGFFTVQASNLCFALGQVSYRMLLKHYPEQPHYQVFGWFYLGAFLITLIAMVMLADFHNIPHTPIQIIVIVWLGIIASGGGFFLWNKGACLVNPGALAVMNNCLIPAGLVVNIAIWNHQANWKQLIIGGSLIVLSLWFNEHWLQKRQLKSRKASSVTP